MRLPSISERVAAAFVGVVFGCVIGVVLAWLIGINSNTLGAGQLAVSFPKWALGGALFFGGIGALFGSSVGTVIGNFIAGIFAFEQASEDQVPRWLMVALIGAAVGVGPWIARAST